MRAVSVLGILLLFALSGCKSAASGDAARLRQSVAKHHAALLASIEGENALVPATLEWLNGAAATQSRSQLRSTACQFTERWAQVYFGPRYVQEQMRRDEYAPGPVRNAHRRILERLRERYFLLHEYQRYGQRACEATPQSYNIQGLPPGLLEFRNRLSVRAKAVDDITPMLASLEQ